jgi:hypothetical protein
MRLGAATSQTACMVGWFLIDPPIACCEVCLNLLCVSLQYWADEQSFTHHPLVYGRPVNITNDNSSSSSIYKSLWQLVHTSGMKHTPRTPMPHV